MTYDPPAFAMFGLRDYEEGDKCLFDGCEGNLEFEHPEGLRCTCGITPAPCSVCTSQILLCNKCGEQYEEER